MKWRIVLYLFALRAGRLLAQFPQVCQKNTTNTFVCCPPVNGQACGGLKHGYCAPVPFNQGIFYSPNVTTDHLKLVDTRFPWPLKFFKNFCYCFGNYYSYDCSQCKFGFYGQNCQERKVITRKEIRELTAKEFQRLTRLLSLARKSQADRNVITSVVADITSGNLSNLQFKNVSWYDFFVWTHSFATDRRVMKSNLGMNDSFVPDFIHGEGNIVTWYRFFLLYIERVAQKLLSDSSFALPYWNWTAALLPPFAQPARRIQRSRFPSWAEVTRCLQIQSYNPYPAYVAHELTFRECFEGLHQKVLKAMRTNYMDAFRNPAFVLHLTFMDKIFQLYYQKQRPTLVSFLEQNTIIDQGVYEFLSPFLPLVTHAYMVTDTENLGYIYSPYERDSVDQNVFWLNAKKNYLARRKFLISKKAAGFGSIFAVLMAAGVITGTVSMVMWISKTRRKQEKIKYYQIF